MTDIDKLKSLKIYLEIVNHLYDKIENLTDDERKEILSGDISININLKPTKQQKKKETQNIDPHLLSEIETKLRNYNDRNDGIDYLSIKLKSKKDFEIFAKYLDIPIKKDDSIDKIKSKIIEYTIGYKLRSKAIQGFET